MACRQTTFAYQRVAIVQTTRDNIYATQSQLRDRQSGVGIEPLTFELETEEPNPLAITTKELGGF